MNRQVYFSICNRLNIFKIKFTLLSLIANLSKGSALTLLCMSTGCGTDKDQTYNQNSEFFYQLSREDQTKYAPTNLFRTIYQNNILDFEDALNENSDKLTQKNNVYDQPQSNDTPLAVAIKLKRTEMIPLIITKMTLKELQAKNAEGRSFVSLLAEIDDVSSFEILQRKYQQQIGFFKNLKPIEEFSNFDFPDDKGRNAAHFVQSKVFLDVLATTWFLRAADTMTIWSNLFYQYDIDGNSFLHAAAKYNKFSVIRWYVENTCGSKPWEGEYFITKAIDTALFGAGKVIQYFQDKEYAFIFWRKLINEKNNMGDSAIHIAAQHGSYESLRALLSCEESNPVLENNMGQMPISSMLYYLSLNTFEDSFSEDYKLTFSLLIDQINPMTIMPGYNFKYYVNLPDHMGNNSIYYAFKLNDKFFYNTLVKYDLGQTNTDGIRPSDSQ
jgi:hypothetical protein